MACLVLAPTADARVFVAPDGRRLSPPAGWACLPPGDEYVVTFESEVEAFLAFSTEWLPLARVMAKRVAAHATPVGSGTVARTKRISVAERAEAAVIAWMRHQTTAYDSLSIARIAGKRREVRRELAQVSRTVLDRHRRDVPLILPRFGGQSDYAGTRSARPVRKHATNSRLSAPRPCT